jgi:hypothetical protein
MKNLFMPIIMAFAFIIGLNAGTRYAVNESAGLKVDNIVVHTVSAVGDSLLTTDQIKANVNLTDSQVISVDSILTDANTKLQGVTDQGDAGKMAKSKIIQDAYSAIRSMLTEAQQAKFDALVGG